MRRAAIALALLALACASSQPADGNQLDIELVQVYGPSDLGIVRGSSAMQIEYAVRIANRSAQPVTLRRISLQSVGSGAYQLRPEEQSYTVMIPPDTSESVRLTARGYFSGTASGDASREPVTLRAILYFEAAAGPFRRIITQNIGQFPGPR